MRGRFFGSLLDLQTGIGETAESPPWILCQASSEQPPQGLGRFGRQSPPLGLAFENGSQSVRDRFTEKGFPAG